jgi:hypothetical protein
MNWLDVHVVRGVTPQSSLPPGERKRVVGEKDPCSHKATDLQGDSHRPAGL